MSYACIVCGAAKQCDGHRFEWPLSNNTISLPSTTSTSNVRRHTLASLDSNTKSYTQSLTKMPTSSNLHHKRPFLIGVSGCTASGKVSALRSQLRYNTCTVSG